MSHTAVRYIAVLPSHGRVCGVAPGAVRLIVRVCDSSYGSPHGCHSGTCLLVHASQVLPRTVVLVLPLYSFPSVVFLQIA